MDDVPDICPNDRPLRNDPAAVHIVLCESMRESERDGWVPAEHLEHDCLDVRQPRAVCECWETRPGWTKDGVKFALGARLDFGPKQHCEDERGHRGGRLL